MANLKEAAKEILRTIVEMTVETERAYRRHLLQGLGWICVALGAIGIVLPVMPTTVFLLAALWAFARSSPRLHTWLIENPYFGPYIADWERDRIIPIRAKVIAVTMMTGSALWLAFGTNAPFVVVFGVVSILIGVASYVLTRPSQPST
ncbi:YbaN family protein [Parvibaculaceae bacterium PLY_AMNH_Bact1]|nr:YbaN family protein [Parvibaculaceae bacterium PLY_AMNH_Bact1]